MKVILISNYCSTNAYNFLFDENSRVTQQNQKYLRLLCEGLIANDVDINAISVPPISRANCKRSIVKLKNDNENAIVFDYVKVTNVPIVRNILSLFRGTWKILRIGKKNRDAVILVDLLNVTSTLSAVIAKKMSGLKVIGYLTDMPMYYLGNDEKRPSFQKKINQYLCSRSVDGYLFLTEEMNKLVNIRSKPYIVVEGFADNNMRNRNNCIELKQVHPKICLYAGMLNKLYGLDMLVEGFIKADIDDYVLEIFGEGPYKDELQEISKGHSNIVYRGVADNKEIISREERATLLINPRYTTAEFTKYSFPSKNMEYMASGTPIITTKLQGMPKDYYPHVFLLEDESVEGMSNLLKKVLNISDVDLSKKGADAKKWILDNKNNIAGTALLKKLIIDLHNN